ncbi:hypothetical protein LCGC14_2624230 [marine sediment metagenome]|uniref:Helicase/UvrB N-terminal domain-containing protein n=1 Tax=marine sediment metagenome TaxID=412755 RepID=A0A0F9A2B0_9ZZZZ
MAKGIIPQAIEDWNSVVFPLTDILLSHPTGCGKTLFAPLRLATQFKAAILVVVPRRIIVQSNLNYYKQATLSFISLTGRSTTPTSPGP